MMTYPIATTNSTITVRTDVMQQINETDRYHTVFSTNMLVAARKKLTEEKHTSFSIPAIDLSGADD